MADGRVPFGVTAANTAALTADNTNLGAGNLRAYVQGQDDRGGAALSN